MSEPRPEEARAVRAGIDRYRAGWRKAVEQGRETDTAVGANLLGQVVPPLAAALSGWVTQAGKGAGKNHSAVDLFALLPANLRALLVCRSVLDGVHRSRTYQQVCIKIGTALAVESILLKADEEDPRWAKGMRKRLPYWSESNKASRLATFLNAEGTRPLPPVQIRCKAGMVALSLFHQITGLVEFVNEKRGKRKTVRMVVPSERLCSWLSGSHAQAELLRPPLPPLHNEPPVEWCDYSGGFPTLQVDMIRARYDQPGPALPLHRALNLQQNTAWRIHTRMLEVVDEAWTRGLQVAELPTAELTPFPPKPDVPEDSEEWMQYRRDRFRIHTVRASEKGKRIAAASLLSLAKAAVGDELYFVHTCDFRGRMYPAASTLSPQAGDLAKSLLEFAKGEPVGRGERELKAYGARLFGLDGTNESCVRWVDAHRQEILSCAQYSLSEAWWTRAKEPWQFLRWCMEMEGVWTQPGWVSHLPIRIDASNNGYQIWALLLRDQTTALATNLVPGPAPVDLYEQVRSSLERKMRERCSSTDMEWLASGLLVRRIVKRPIMVVPYGATVIGLVESLRTGVEEECARLGCPVPFSDLTVACVKLAQDVLEEVRTQCPAIMEGSEWVQGVARELGMRGDVLEWQLPTGLMVRNDYRKKKSVRVQTYCGKSYAVTKLSEDTPALDRGRCIQTAMPNLTHSFDAALAALTVVKAAEAGVESFAIVHDSFGTHAAHLATLKDTLLSCAAEMFGGEVSPLVVLRDALAPELPDPPVVGTYDPKTIQKSSYFAY